MASLLIDNFKNGTVEFILNGKVPKPPMKLTEDVSGVVGGVRDVQFDLVSAPDRTCGGEFYILNDGMECLTLYNRNKSSNTTATIKYGSTSAPLNKSVAPGRFVLSLLSMAGAPTLSISVNGSAFVSKVVSGLADVSFPARLFGRFTVIDTVVLKISGQPDYDIELTNFSYEYPETIVEKKSAAKVL